MQQSFSTNLSSEDDCFSEPESDVTTNLKNFYAAILSSAIHDLERYRDTDTLKKASTKRFVKLKWQIAKEWFSENPFPSRVSFDTCLLVLGHTRSQILNYLKTQGLYDLLE